MMMTKDWTRTYNILFRSGTVFIHEIMVNLVILTFVILNSYLYSGTRVSIYLFLFFTNVVSFVDFKLTLVYVQCVTALSWRRKTFLLQLQYLFPWMHAELTFSLASKLMSWISKMRHFVKTPSYIFTNNHTMFWNISWVTIFISTYILRSFNIPVHNL